MLTVPLPTRTRPLLGMSKVHMGVRTGSTNNSNLHPHLHRHTPHMCTHRRSGRTHRRLIPCNITGRRQRRVLLLPAIIIVSLVVIEQGLVCLAAGILLHLLDQVRSSSTRRVSTSPRHIITRNTTLLPPRLPIRILLRSSSSIELRAPPLTMHLDPKAMQVSHPLLHRIRRIILMHIIRILQRMGSIRTLCEVREARIIDSRSLHPLFV